MTYSSYQKPPALSTIFCHDFVIYRTIFSSFRLFYSASRTSAPCPFPSWPARMPAAFCDRPAPPNVGRIQTCGRATQIPAPFFTKKLQIFQNCDTLFGKAARPSANKSAGAPFRNTLFERILFMIVPSMQFAPSRTNRPFALAPCSAARGDIRLLAGGAQ